VRTAIVLLHGIGQQTHTVKSYAATVRTVSVNGMRAAGYHALVDREFAGDLELRPAFYGDLYTNWSGQGAEGLVEAATDPGQREIEEELALALLRALMDRAEDPVDRETAAAALAAAGVVPVDASGAQSTSLRREAADLVARLLGTRWAGGHRIARTLDHVPRVSWLPLREVSDYLLIHRAAIQQRLHECLDRGGVRVVVAHSLGSVVAWETLAQRSEPLPLLLTLGSSLGLPGAVYHRLQPTPPCWPGPVSAWVNLSAPADMVATPQKLRDLFPNPAGRPLLDDTVDIRPLTLFGPHDLTRYLSTPDVWHHVASAVLP
jgi:hypothetical protein